MSGLVGIFRFSGAPDLAPLAAMTRAMDARGPDARADVVVAHGGMGVTALAPDGESPGPAWDTERTWCVATDGTWVNARALHQELLARDRTESRASAALAATVFAELGFERGIARLRGDVAIAAWDSGARRLWLARDRTGQRPMHWARLPDGTLLFASEPRAILSHPRMPRRADNRAISHLLTLGALPAPLTPWVGIHKLAPGTTLAIDADGTHELRYWSDGANPAGAYGNRQKWALSAQFGFELAARQRAPVDEGLAVALSGGVFSTAVLGVAVERRRDQVLAVTVGFEDAADERPAARIEATRLKAEYTEIVLRKGEIPELLTEMAASVDEPLTDPESLAWWVMARHAWVSGRRVLLGGEGGAALFGGHAMGGRLTTLPGARMLGRMARRVGGARLEARREPWGRRRARLHGHPVGDESPDAWSALDALAAAAPAGDPAGEGLWLDRHFWLGEGAFPWMDRAAAAHGVAAHSPFGDPDLAVLVSGIPAGQLDSHGPRSLFCDAAAARLRAQPPAPRGMGLPIAAWLAGSDALRGLPESLEGVVEPERVRAVEAAFAAGAPHAARALWALLAVARWRAAGWA